MKLDFKNKEQNMFCFSFLLLLAYFGSFESQECLKSPDHVAHVDSSFATQTYSGEQTDWIYDSSIDAYRYTLTIKGVEISKNIDGGITTFTTRAFDGNLPGKNFILRRGNHYKKEKKKTNCQF